MSKLPPMPLHVNELMSDSYCRRLTDADFGRYMRILCRQWEEGDVPKEASEVVRDAGLDLDSVERVKELLAEKFIAKDGGLANEKLAEVRSARLAQAEARRENGKLGGRPKNGSGTTGSSPKAKVKKKSAKQKREEEAAALEGFDDFWATYPRREAKPRARKAWIKHDLRSKREAVMAGLQNALVKWRGKDIEFIPHASTWINNERWTDEIGKNNVRTVDPFDRLGPEWITQLLQEVQSSDSGVLHQRGNIDTERAMRRLARAKGLI